MKNKKERKESDNMEDWLNCTISEGQFSGEFAVQGEMFDSTGFSLFLPENDLFFSKPPKGDEHIKGAIRVRVLDQKDDLILVELPQPTFENGQAITVKANQVRKIQV